MTVTILARVRAAAVASGHTQLKAPDPIRTRKIRGSIADPVDVLNSLQLLNLVYAFCRAGVVLYATQLSFHDV